MKFTKFLPPLRISEEIYLSIKDKSEKAGLSVSEYRRSLILKDLDFISFRVDGLIDIDFKNKDRHEIRLPKAIFKLIEESGNLNLYDSFSSYIQSIIIAEISGLKILSDDDKNKLNLIRLEIQSLGRNLNQIARSLNYQIKVNDSLNLDSVIEAIELINEIEKTSKEINSEILEITRG